MKQSQRPEVMFLIDTHFGPTATDTFRDFSAERIVRGLTNMGVDAVMFQTKCSRGFAYYDSKIAPRHPALRRDIIAPLVRLAGKADLRVFLYTCVTNDWFCGQHYPEMWLLDQNGNPYNKDVVCVNGPYRQRYLAVIDELARTFPADGLFVDGPEPGYGCGDVWPTPCYCDSCRALWQRRYREPMPRRAEQVCRERLVQFLIDNCASFAAQTARALRRHQPAARVWVNSSVPYPTTGEAFMEVDAYHRNFYRPNLFMKRLRALYGDAHRVHSLTIDKPAHHAESEAMVAWETATYLAHKPVEVMLWSSPDLATMWYPLQIERKVRGALDQVAGLRDEMAEPMQVLADVAIGYSYRDILLNATKALESHFPDESVGALRLLSDAHIPFTIVDLDRPLALQDISALLVGPLQTLPASQVRAILAWVRRGGRLIVTARSPVTDALPGLALGERFTVDNTSTWCGPTPAGYCMPPWRPDGDPWSVARGYYPVLKHAGWKVVGQILPQAVYRLGRDFDHAHRPARTPVGAGILQRKLGRGQVLYFNHEVFAESISRGVNLFRDIPLESLRTLGLQPRFELSGCLNAECNHYRTAKGYKVVLTNGFTGRPIVGNGEPAAWGEISDIVTVADLTLTCRVPVASARSRQLGPLEIRQSGNGVTSVSVPRLGLWDVVTVQG